VTVGTEHTTEISSSVPLIQSDSSVRFGFGSSPISNSQPSVKQLKNVKSYYVFAFLKEKR